MLVPATACTRRNVVGELIIRLEGGDKSTQQQDIRTALALAKDL